MLKHRKRTLLSVTAVTSLLLWATAIYTWLNYRGHTTPSELSCTDSIGSACSVYSDRGFFVLVAAFFGFYYLVYLAVQVKRSHHLAVLHKYLLVAAFTVPYIFSVVFSAIMFLTDRQ